MRLIFNNQTVTTLDRNQSIALMGSKDVKLYYASDVIHECAIDDLNIPKDFYLEVIAHEEQGLLARYPKDANLIIDFPVEMKRDWVNNRTFTVEVEL